MIASLTCLFAIVLAASSLAVLHGLGVVVRPSTACPIYEGSQAGVYSACEIWQDTRAILSFVLGAVLCSVVHCYQNNCPLSAVYEVDEGEKIQFSACFL